MANNTGTFFNVNDNDGIPLVGVSTDGKVMINHLYGNCLIGSTSITGTSSQPLQVTGGAYVSGNLGIGTTNPTVKLQVQGDGRFTGVVTATSFTGNLTGIASTANDVSSTININTSGIITATRFVGGLVGIASTATTALGFSTTASINTTGIITATSFTGNFTGTATTANNVSSTININTTGIITATRFVGGLTGTASTATTALGFSTTASINTTGIITASSFVGSFVGVASTATTALGFSTTASINTSGIITATGGFSGMWISAKNFGAKGDGTTNDTTSIQNALNSLTSGGTLYIPPGTYILSGTTGVTIPSNVRVVGAGVSATYLRQNVGLTAGISLLSATGKNNITIEHITFDGNNYTNDSTDALLNFTFTDSINVKNCSFINFDKQGLFLNSVVNGIVKDNYFYRTSTANTQNQGLTVTYSTYYTPVRETYNIIVDSNTFINSATIFACHSSTIKNNYIKGFGYGAGITIEASSYVYNINIDKNVSTGGTGTDASGYKCGGIENWSPNCSITNNVIYANSGCGIDQGGRYCIVSNNLIYDNGITSPGNPGIAGRVLTLNDGITINPNYDSSYSKYINNTVGLTTNYTGVGQSYAYLDQSYPSNSTYPLGIGATITQVSFIDNNFSAFTGNKTGEMYILGSKYSLDVRKNGNIGIGTTNPTAKVHIGAATTSAAGSAPLKIGAGTVLLTTPEVGAIEYDGSYLYQTPNSTSGRAPIPPVYTFRRTTNGDAIGSISDFFTTPSSLSLEASSVYKITCFAYFLKTTAGTATWTQVFSSAPIIAEGYHYTSPVTGLNIASSASYTQLEQYFYNQGATTFAWNPSGTNLTTTVNHFYRVDMTVLTNAATNWRLRLSQSAGTVTPLIGSYYTIQKISTSTGTFVA